ncbi:MAG: hypothetical protein KGZ25_06145 [Planctomycetes bacterium]|nr:hypothetical protein [Planctomycetota bacterium]
MTCPAWTVKAGMRALKTHREEIRRTFETTVTISVSPDADLSAILGMV